MNKRYDKFNPKRRVKRLDDNARLQIASLAERVRYGGNPEHKKNPGDFGLTPPSGPRRGKSLCDDAEIFQSAVALSHLRNGLTKGLISERFQGDWPQNIWSVTENGRPLEAQLENPSNGTYHGYPMPETDPLASEIAQLWAKETE
jgi:hypothetical protein